MNYFYHQFVKMVDKTLVPYFFKNNQKYSIFSLFFYKIKK